MTRLLATLDDKSRARLERVLVAGALVAAALLLAGEWLRVADEPLSPDAWNFRSLVANGLRHPYDTGYREPLHCWLVRLVLLAGGTSDGALRGLSVGLYLVSLGIYYATTRKLFGRGLAAICLFLYALSRKNAALAVEGLRNFEVVSALCLVALAARGAVERPAEARPQIVAGLASALASLTYLSLLVVTQLWMGLNSLLERARVGRRQALALAIPVALVLPHLWDNAVANGDFLDTLNRHARFYRNLEYVDRPGFPTAAQIASDAYCGPPTTGLRYALEGRTPGEVARIAATGLGRWATYRSSAYEAYRTDHFRHFGIPIWALALAGGCLIVAKNRRFLWVPALVGACGLPFVFLLGIHQLDGRLLNDYLFAWLWLLAGFLPATQTARSEEDFHASRSP